MALRGHLGDGRLTTVVPDPVYRSVGRLLVTLGDLQNVMFFDAMDEALAWLGIPEDVTGAIEAACDLSTAG